MLKLELLLRRSHWLAAIVIAAGFVTTSHHADAAATKDANSSAKSVSDSAPALFTPAILFATKADQVVERGPQVERFRAVNIDRDMLLKAAGAPRAFGPGASFAPSSGHSITLNLFDDAVYIADADQVEQTARGMTWIGTLRGVELSQVVLVINGDVVAGNISMPAARYHIRYVTNGTHEVQEIDQSKFPVDERSVPVSPLEPLHKDAPAKDPAAQSDDGSIVDVMVIYTAKTRVAAGGTTPMRAEIDLAMAETNRSYLNSGVSHRVRLVHAGEVTYTETGTLDDALDCVTSKTDGCLDNVHALRDLYAADLVSFWVETGNDACGLGWWNLPSAGADRGFSAITRSCATGTYSFGHELGHNMGTHHDVYVEPATTKNQFAHGYVNINQGWRTVMAYDKSCADAGKKCSRIPYWSNPGRSYASAVLGNSSADNHRVLNNSAFAVANFRTDPFVRPQIPAGGGNFIANPGFESGPGGWVQNIADLIWNGSESSHSGAWVAWLGYVDDANDVVYQDVAIPANAQQATLQFWYRVTTNETTTTVAYDFATVEVLNAATGATLVSLGTVSNLNVTNGWVQSTPTDLTAFKGSTVRVRFRATTDENKGTSFFFDDIVLNVSVPVAVTATVIEFYNTNLDNYFITSNPVEAAAIDGGSAGPGWARTGAGFNFNAGGDTPVCRFYGSPSPGPNSHFYTVSTAECNALKAQQAATPATLQRWNFESLDFNSTPPVNGACPAGKVPVYRAYNNGFTRRVDSNHRITANAAGIAAVVARGWANEGVVMCAPM